MASDFELALNEIGDEGRTLTRPVLAGLSAPTRAQLRQFVGVYDGLSVARRRELVMEMVECAEENFELAFEELFRHALSDEDPLVRRSAVEGLWEYERADLILPLLRMMNQDPDVAVRAAAASALGRFLFMVECEELEAHHGALIRAGLEAVIEDPAEAVEVQRRAVESIAFINDGIVRRIIDRAYAHDDPGMRQSALFAMGRNADRFWTETVLAELYAEAPGMRLEAARAAGEMSLRRAVEQLIQLVEDVDRDVQQAAVWALGQIGGKRARGVLERYVESEDEDLAAMADEALQEIEFGGGAMYMMVHDPSEETDIDDRIEDDEPEDLDEQDDDEAADRNGLA
jgi:hypothetical protein